MRPAGARSKRAGRWSAYTTELEKRREWRIQADQWVKYVPFGDGVSYEHAELIVLAIKHSQLVNWLAGNAVPLPGSDNRPRRYNLNTSQGKCCTDI